MKRNFDSPTRKAAWSSSMIRPSGFVSHLIGCSLGEVLGSIPSAALFASLLFRQRRDESLA